MSAKDWLVKHQPIQVYIVLILSVLLFAIELLVSHVTHSLTLLTNSYQMMCNIFALLGYVATIKLKEDQRISANQAADHVSEKSSKQSENKLKNTFGWARIDVISMLICCVFLLSLCFSVLVEALQTLVHIDHFDEMHYTVWVMCTGFAGILLNVLCYVTIGGFTFHQGSFLFVTKSGDVILDKDASGSDEIGDKSLLKSKRNLMDIEQNRQGFRAVLRDILGPILVIVCSSLVYVLKEDKRAKYVDPAFSLIYALSLMYLSVPFMKESCFILLQTIPGSINIDNLTVDLVKHFPDILNVHDFHVWQLTANKVISTIHIIFHNPEVYARVVADIKRYFMTNGITHVTIQPEFFVEYHLKRPDKFRCMMKCNKDWCDSNQCCVENEEHEDQKTLENVVVSKTEADTENTA